MLSNLRKSVFYLQQAIREGGDDVDQLLEILDKLSKIATKQISNDKERNN